MAKTPQFYLPNEDTEAMRYRLGDFIVAHLTPSQGRDKWCCPYCGSGKKEHGTGEFAIRPDNIHWHCWSCKRQGDIFDLAGELYGLDNLNDQKRMVADWCGRFGGCGAVYAEQTKPKETRDYKPYLDGWCKTIKPQAVSYLSSRHISEGAARDTGTEYVIGYNSNAWFEGKKAHPAIIIPITDSDGTFAYILRNTEYNPQTMAKAEKWYIKKSGFYRLSALYQDKPVYVCESAIDCMSFVEIGAEAMAINSTDNENKFADYVIDHYREIRCGELILAFDNDRSGMYCEEFLRKRLSAISLTISTYDGLRDTGYKDINDYLVNDKINFERGIRHGR